MNVARALIVQSSVACYNLMSIRFGQTFCG